MSSVCHLTAKGLKYKPAGEVTRVSYKKVEFDVFWDNEWKIFVAMSGDWKCLRVGIEQLKEDMIRFADKRQV